MRSILYCSSILRVVIYDNNYEPQASKPAGRLPVGHVGIDDAIKKRCRELDPIGMLALGEGGYHPTRVRVCIPRSRVHLPAFLQVSDRGSDRRTIGRLAMATQYAEEARQGVQ